MERRHQPRSHPGLQRYLTSVEQPCGATIDVILYTSPTGNDNLDQPDYLGFYTTVQSARLSLGASAGGTWTPKLVSSSGMPYWQLTCPANSKGLLTATEPLTVTISGLNTQFAPGFTPIV
jgi:hypothetical protein